VTEFLPLQPYFLIPMKILVIGGTGTVGSQVVRELLVRGAKVGVLTRQPEKARLPDGVTVVRGDLLDPDTARHAFRGFDRVFMLNATGPTENHEGLMGVWGARAAGVQHFVYLSIHRLHTAPHIPHFASKMPIEAAVQASGMGWTILRPNNFFQNDEWFKEAILKHGVYPQPVGPRGLSRVDVRDIAEAAASALTQPGHSGQIYELAGPDILTGVATAEIWSRALGRSVAYAGDDLEQWETSFRPWLAPWMLYDFRLMYDWFIQAGLAATPDELRRLTKLLGHPPRSFEAYVKETAASWLRQAA
jgi:uncharacterized protein YbjT (DUF2867 family)